MEQFKTAAFINVFETKLTKQIAQIKKLRSKKGDPNLIKILIGDAKKLRSIVRKLQSVEDNGMKSRDEILNRLGDVLRDENPTKAMVVTIDTLRWVLNDV